MEIYRLNQFDEIPINKKLTFKKALNSKLVDCFLKFQFQRVWAYPRHLIIDLINECGLKCPMCPKGRGEITRKTASVNVRFFQQLLDKLGPFLFSLSLTNWGEPFRHPRVLELIRYARRYPISIGFSSNLQNLPEEWIDDLILTDIDVIGCSVDGATADTYGKTRVGGDFSTAFGNMKRLVERKRILQVDKPKIRWQVLLNRNTEPELDLIIKTAEEIGVDSLVFIPVYVDITHMFSQSPMERLKRDKAWIPADEALSWYDYNNGSFKRQLLHCTKLWDSMVVHPDGSVSPCCAVIDECHDFGRLRSVDDFWKVWNGARYRAARRIMSGKETEDDQIVCSHCRKHGIQIY